MSTGASLDGSSCEPSHAKKRSIDYLLAGESVKNNRLLARFANAPYLDFLLHEPAFSAMLSRTSKALRKELTEAYAVLEALETAGIVGGAPPSALIDLCSGKGFLSVILALEWPQLPVVMVDSNMHIKDDHVAAVPNLRFVREDITRPGFRDALETIVRSIASERDGDGRMACVAVGVHLCGPLSPTAIELFGSSDLVDALLLVPCCLDKRTDGLLKMRARELGIDPYDCKVTELVDLLEAVRGCTVSVTREAAMRTQSGGAATEGSAGAKNAIIVGQKHGSIAKPEAAGWQREGDADDAHEPEPCGDHDEAESGEAGLQCVPCEAAEKRQRHEL